MNTIEKTVTAPRTVNAVCVDVEDLGMRDTPYGRKHQYKVAFELDEENDYGEPIFLYRWYNVSTHKDSAFRRDMESWMGHSLSDEEMAKVTFKSLLNQQFQIKTEPVEKNGKTYENVATLRPSFATVKPSGLYKRKN